MVVLSVLPVVGGALVWVPAVIVMGVQGHWQSALGVALFNALIVGSVDNVLGRGWSAATPRCTT